MLNESTRRDAAHLGILTSAARAFENWHNAQIEPIQKRMMRRHLNDDKSLEIGGFTLQLPPVSLFEHFRQIDADLRNTSPPAHEDRKHLAEIRCWLRDGLDDLIAFELDRAVTIIDLAVNKLDWVLHERSRAGSRRYRILDASTVARLTDVLDSAAKLLVEVKRVQTLVAA